MIETMNDPLDHFAIDGLLARLEAASGPDRMLDRDISVALRVLHEDPGSESADHPGLRALYRINDDGGRSYGGLGDDILIRPLTASIEATLRLAERFFPGCWFILGRGRTRVDEPLYGAMLLKGDTDHGDPDGELGEGEHEHSLALAALIALLQALL